ncbi:MAG TPA: hypothetical protein DIU18_04050 [Gemmatimonadetes bacterium]|nr:hypothetical protein [Gemmatimonadota bacterium]
MRRWPLLLPLLPLLAACAGSGAGPPMLAYHVPAPPVVDYLVGDTSWVDVKAVDQGFELGMAASARWRMEFVDADADHVQVTATLAELAARVANPVTTAQTADESVLSGPVVFTLDPQGQASLVRLPTLSPPAAFQVVSGAKIAHTFFPGLPGRVVSVGDGWVDTVSYATQEGAAGTTVRMVMSYTAVGDTVVGRANYLLVRTKGTSEQSAAGVISKTDFSQTVAGTTEGYFLWDSVAGILHSLEYRSDLRGTMQLAALPVPLDVRIRTTLRVMRTD